MKENLVVTDVFDDEKMFHIETEEGIVFGLEKRFLNGVVPKVGDKINLHLELLSRIVGVDINGEEIYYLTHEQRKALDKEFAEEYKACNRERFEKDRNLLDKMFSLLPKLLQDRINLYRKFVPDFRADFEDYELSAVFLSYKIYKHCKADSYESFVKNLEDFDYDRYIRNHEVLKTRGMSINQVQFAQALATGLFRDEMEKKISLSAPTEAMLRMSAVMDMPNALCTIGEIFCTPRKEYIDKYIQG